MKNIAQLKQWLFNKPIMFSLIFFGLTLILGVLYSFIQSIFDIKSPVPLFIIFAFSLIYSAYYMIKKLPHDKMSQKDFVAIANGSSIISVASSALSLSIFGLYSGIIRQKMMMMYLLHPTVFSIIVSLIILVSLYVIGVAFSGIYAKYKRATTIGIEPWKVILSMPFSFLMVWTPGYLIEDKTKKSNLVIKSKWYTQFNNWVVSNFANLLFVFLFLQLTKSVIAGVPTTVLSISLLIIYTLWYVKHKSDFIKNINKGYALTSVGINLAIWSAVIIALIAQ